uniref:Zinc finger PMZ-type domain-containing protein n=1 Tax=Aegilops tauschii subsp. strangulata TaxID=200361 RepID=A0A452XZR0_AEGTS
MTAMPCNHAVSAIVKAKLQPEDFVDDFFKKAMYKKAYGHIIFPVPGPNLWPRSRTQDIEPPVFRDKELGSNKQRGGKTNLRSQHQEIHLGWHPLLVATANL